MFKKAASRIFPNVVPLLFMQANKASCGTGTVIEKGGTILTANHVVPEGSGIKLMAGRNYRECVPGMYNTKYEIISRFPRHDLALIRCPSLPLDEIEVPVSFSWEELSYGDPLGSFGYPQPHVTQEQSEQAGSKSIIVSVQMVLRFKSYFIAGTAPEYDQAGPGASSTRSYMLDSFAYGGHSGGPVFDHEGAVVAVMSKTQLHEKDRREISYCEAEATFNIKRELESISK